MPADLVVELRRRRRDSSSTLQNPINQYQSQGDYTVTLVVSNFGGSSTKSRTVTVTP